MEDDNSMSERILRTIENAFKDDPQLESFWIIPTDVNSSNRSPVHHHEHNLGLESWCVKHIYRYAYLELFEARQALRRRKLCSDRETGLNRLLMGVLLINPDAPTLWNMKRELVENDVLGIEDELFFSKICLSYKSKSNEVFAYRRWLLKRMLTKFALNALEPPNSLLENELGVCTMAANKMANNYHAWTHRIWCMENVPFCTVLANLSTFILSELQFVFNWISCHVSEHTGYHYRQYLIQSVMRRNMDPIYGGYYNQIIKDLPLESDTQDLLVFFLGKPASASKTRFTNYITLLLYDLLHMIDHWNSLLPCHESLWYYRRFLIYHLLKASYDYHDITMKPCVKIDDSIALDDSNIVNCDAALFKYNHGEKEPKMSKMQPDKVESSLLYKTLMRTESEFIRLSTRNDLERDLAKKHEKWLKFAVGLEPIS